MLRPKKRTVQNDCSGSSIGSADTGGFDSSSVCYDAMSPSNVTVSLQPKSPRPPASRRAGDSQATTAQSLGSASVGSPSLGSISTVVSQTPSLAESIGSFDADKMQTEERKTLVSEHTRGDRLPLTRVEKRQLFLQAPEDSFLRCSRTLTWLEGTTANPPSPAKNPFVRVGLIVWDYSCNVRRIVYGVGRAATQLFVTTAIHRTKPRAASPIPPHPSPCPCLLS